MKSPAVRKGMPRSKGSDVRTLGLDLGASSLKAVELSHRGAQKTITRLACLPISEPGDPEALARVLGEWVKGWGVSGREVGIAMGGPAVLVRFILMPQMTDAELAGAARFEAEKVFPYKLEEMTFDARVVEPNLQGGKMRVLFVGAKRAMIDQEVARLSGEGLSPSFLDVDLFAIQNLFEYGLPELFKGQGVALIHLGHRVTSLQILHGGIPYLSRYVAIGGHDLTAAIQEGLKISESEAAALKHAPGDRAKELEAFWHPVLDRLTRELRLSFDYSESEFGRSVETILCSGGGSVQTGIEPILQEALGISIASWDLSQKFLFAPDVSVPEFSKNQRSLAVAIGLALRA